MYKKFTEVIVCSDSKQRACEKKEGYCTILPVFLCLLPIPVYAMAPLCWGEKLVNVRLSGWIDE